MTNSADLYLEICSLAKTPQAYFFMKNRKNFYLQIVTTIFFELTTAKNSPLISKFCASNGINFVGKNFKIDSVSEKFIFSTSYDMHCIIFGLHLAISENLETAAQFFEQCKEKIFRGTFLTSEDFLKLADCLKIIDSQLGKFFSAPETIPPQKISDEEEKIFLQSLNNISENRKNNDEKIIDEIKKIQLSMQAEAETIQKSLKQISDLRDEIDFRGMDEPIRQMIQLYYKLSENLKRHPQADEKKGYDALIKRCNSFLKYITQSLAMLGVEIINDTGKIFDPDKNKISDDAENPLDATVTKILKAGFIYKGKVLEKAEVEISKPEKISAANINYFFGGKNFS